MARTISERSELLPVLAEVFRNFGFEGASLARICEGTGLGKGSLYHFFPGGKDEMAEAVLAAIDGWFRQHVFEPLRDGDGAGDAFEHMFGEVDSFFDGGSKVCVVGLFALGNERDRFTGSVRRYFVEWIAALAAALQRAGRDQASAAELAVDTVGAIQGALVLARALDRPAVLTDTISRLRARLS
jgi:TetR/AcrR family transcriptional repressor of lmrAB and yxaGH operons